MRSSDHSHARREPLRARADYTAGAISLTTLGAVTIMNRFLRT